MAMAAWASHLRTIPPLRPYVVGQPELLPTLLLEHARSSGASSASSRFSAAPSGGGGEGGSPLAERDFGQQFKEEKEDLLPNS